MSKKSIFRNPKFLHNKQHQKAAVAVSVAWGFFITGVMEARMAAKGKKNPSEQSSWNVKFVNMTLTKEQRIEFAAWYKEHVQDLETLWEDHVSMGYKMSFRWDNENDCYIASSTGTEDNKHNKNLCLTSRSDVLAEAVMLQIYKTNVLCKNGVWEVEDNSRSWG